MRSHSWLFVTLALTAGAVEGARAPEATRPPAVCFAKGTDPAYVARNYASVAAASSLGPEPESFQFTAPRWQATATSGGGLLQGFPTVLTWSVVPDGLTIPTGGVVGEVTAPSNLRARLNAIYGSQAVWQPIIQQALDEWAARTGTRYDFVSDDGAPFSFASPGSNAPGQIRGDIRIGGHHLDGNFGVLAYNYFPDRGDMVIDTNDSFYTNTTTASLALRNVIAHEQGHGLGISHVCPINETKLMEPFFSDNFVGIQHDDLLAGQRGYGDDRENNDTFGTGTDLGTLGTGTVNVTSVGLDDNSDNDFYRFTVGPGKRATITATPIGSTYLQGPQNSNGSCTAGTSFNSLTLNDLNLQLLGTNGTTVLASATTLPAGQAETIPLTALPSGGQFYFRVFPGSSDTVQLYNVSLTLVDSNDLAITKTDGATTAIPGQPITYTIVASNVSSSGAPTAGAAVVDNFPASIAGVSWSCAAAAGASCGGGGGTGNINRAVSLPPGGSVTFTATGTILPTATGTLVNTATITPDAGSDPVPANNTATDTDTLAPTGDVAVSKTDGQAFEVPGTPVTYTMVVSNPGPSTASGVVVNDAFPAAITGVTWTCVGAGGATCAAPAGAGNIATTVTVPPSGTATFTATGTVQASATGSLVNVVTAATVPGFTDTNIPNNTAIDTDTLTPTADLAVTKTDGQPSAVPGTPLTYTIVASNGGPSASGTATLADPFPASLTGVTWSCVATAGSTCPASGAGSLSAAVTLTPTGTATFTVTGTIAPAATGTLVNTATVSGAAGVTDPSAANNSATDTDTLTPQADFSVTKTDGQLVAVPGAPIQYTVVVRQSGPSAAGAATVTDTLPGEITGTTWTCTASGGSTCPASGAGNVSVPVTLAVDGTATFVLSGTVSGAATGALSNTASVAAPGSVTDPVAGNDQATDTDNVSFEMSELVHATTTTRDLRPIGGAPAEHFYWLAQQPFASYEILVDATSGDVGPTLQLARLAGDGTTVLQSALGTSAIGFSRSLRFTNDSPAAKTGELIRVASGACGTGCGPDDVYRLRMRETTGRIPRYNNSATQGTVVILQNTSTETVTGTMRFWSGSGAPAAAQAFTLPPHGLAVVNTSAIAGLAGTSGSVTVVHDGAYGALVGKSVALEPATGFSFDSPLSLLAR